ncbi:MAG: hypothetical protein AB1449_10770 [Chloroflexota bacterium]
MESFVSGFVTAVLFVPIWNLFAARQEQQAASTMKAAGEHHA